MGATVWYSQFCHNTAQLKLLGAETFLLEGSFWWERFEVMKFLSGDNQWLNLPELSRQIICREPHVTLRNWSINFIISLLCQIYQRPSFQSKLGNLLVAVIVKFEMRLTFSSMSYFEHFDPSDHKLSEFLWPAICRCHKLRKVKQFLANHFNI